MKHEAFNPAQIVTQLRPWTRVIEVMDEKTGKPTGKYKPMVDMPDVDADDQRASDYEPFARGGGEAA